MALQRWMKERDPRSHPAHHQDSPTVKVRDCKSLSMVIRSPNLELFYSESEFLSHFFIITAPGSPFRYFFLIMNPTPQDISIPQVYYISISVLDIFICALYVKRVSFFHPQEPILGQLTTAKYSCSKYIHGTLLQCQAIQVFPKIPISMFLTWPFCENWNENSWS